MRQTKDFVDQIMDYESGELNDKEIIEMFSDMVKSGTAWSLQGHYSRTAEAFIFNEILDKQGNILIDLEEYDNI
jgi:hypothetical protein